MEQEGLNSEGAEGEGRVFSPLITINPRNDLERKLIANGNSRRTMACRPRSIQALFSDWNFLVETFLQNYTQPYEQVKITTFTVSFTLP